MRRRFVATHAHDLAEGELSIRHDGNRRSRRSLIQPAKQSRCSSLHREDADVAVEQKSKRHSEGLDGVGSRIRNLVWEGVVGERRKIGQRLTELGRPFAKHDVVASAEHLHLLAAKPELLRQPYSLAIARLKYPGDRRRVNVGGRRRFADALEYSPAAFLTRFGHHSKYIRRRIYSTTRFLRLTARGHSGVAITNEIIGVIGDLRSSGNVTGEIAPLVRAQREAVAASRPCSASAVAGCAAPAPRPRPRSLPLAASSGVTPSTSATLGSAPRSTSRFTTSV